jgi:hypothetical protein
MNSGVFCGTRADSLAATSWAMVFQCAAACSLCCLLVSKLVASGAGAWGVAQAVASMAASAAAMRLLFIEQDLRIGIALVMVTE